MNNVLEPDRVAISRTYEGKYGGKVRFSIGIPYTAGSDLGTYKCDYIVELGSRRIARTVEGMDGLHVFLLCLSTIKKWIVEAGIVDPLLYRWIGADEWGELGFSLE